MQELDAVALEEQVTDYAAIALATAAMEHVLEAARVQEEPKRALSGLIRELWDWQAGPHSSGHADMSKDDARGLASYRFYSSLPTFAALRDQHRDVPHVHALLSGVVDALTFIVWVMDGIERLLNWGKPVVVGDEIGDDSWDGLVAALDELARSTPDPGAERAWQLGMLARVIVDHPGIPGEEVLGRPVKKQYFEAS
jgi:hypothetical protein